MGDFLHNVGKGHYAWLLPMGPDPRTAEWLTQLADKATEERSTRLERPWTESDNQAYRQWLDEEDAMEQTQAGATEREFSSVTMKQVWVPCPHGTKEVPRTAPYEGAAPACGAHPRPDGRSTTRGTGDPMHGYNGLVRHMYWGLRRAMAEFEEQKARYERVDRKALERIDAEKKAQKRAVSQAFFHTERVLQGRDEDHDGVSSSHSIIANQGSVVADGALPRHLQQVPRAEAGTEGASPP